MSENYSEVFTNGLPSVYETKTDRKRSSDESNRRTKRLKNDSIAQSSDDSGISLDVTQLSTTSSTDEVIPTESFTTQELSSKLVPTLNALVLKGCFENFERKSILIKEYSKYCAKNKPSIEMLVKCMSAIDLTAERKLMDFCRDNCPNIKCLRLSHCRLTIDTMKSLKRMFRLQCLHLEYIYGIDTDEEWTEVGRVFHLDLINIAFNDGGKGTDLTGMLTNLEIFSQLALQEYSNDMSALFSSVSPHLYKLSLIDYFGVDGNAIKALADRCGEFLFDLTVIYDTFHLKRANTSALFVSICEKLPKLKSFRFKLISETNMRPVFKLTELRELYLQFSQTNFILFPSVYHLESLRTLSLTNVYLTPTRVESMAKAFPFLLELSITGRVNKHFIDSAVFCCECKGVDKTLDYCPLCYQNCFIALIEFTILATLKLNFVRIKSSISSAIPYIPCLKRLVINPYECLCGRALLVAAIKISLLRRFKFIIRECFIEHALKEETLLPEKLEIIEYDKNVHD